MNIWFPVYCLNPLNTKEFHASKTLTYLITPRGLLVPNDALSAGLNYSKDPPSV